MKELIEKYDGKKYTLKEYLPVIFMFLMVIGFGVYTIIKKGEFVDIFLSTEFDGKVVDVYEERSFIYLQISNKTKKYKITNSCNYDYDPFILSEFLERNDRVIKSKCSDTIFIERNLKKYHFLIGSTSYNNNKKKPKELIEKYNLKRAILNERNDCN